MAVVSSEEQEITSYGGIEMRMIISDFKVKIKDEMNMNKYPANLYRDDEVKITVNNFINEQRTKNLLRILKSSAADPFEALKKEASFREANSVSFSSDLTLKAISGNDNSEDLFTDYDFVGKSPLSKTMTMSEIFV